MRYSAHRKGRTTDWNYRTLVRAKRSTLQQQESNRDFAATSQAAAVGDEEPEIKIVLRSGVHIDAILHDEHLEFYPSVARGDVADNTGFSRVALSPSPPLDALLAKQ